MKGKSFSKMGKQKRKLISICVPILNEEENLADLITQLQVLAESNIDKYRFEFVFTDNASTDSSWEVLKQLAIKEKRIRAFRFSRNIGFQSSLLFNFLSSKGDAIVQLDADLQDPPELINTFIKQWEKGFMVVTGIRAERKENFLISRFRIVGYWLINKVSDHPIQRNAGDFRLLDRLVVNQLREVKTPSPYIRGIISSLSFPESTIPYGRQSRLKGKSKFGIFNLVRFGLTALGNHSNLPFRVMNLIGIIALLISTFGFIYIMVIRFMFEDLPRGFASIYVLLIFGIGLNAVMLSIIGTFIRKLYVMLNGEPKRIVIDSIDSGK